MDPKKVNTSPLGSADLGSAPAVGGRVATQVDPVVPQAPMEPAAASPVSSAPFVSGEPTASEPVAVDPMAAEPVVTPMADPMTAATSVPSIGAADTSVVGVDEPVASEPVSPPVSPLGGVTKGPSKI